MYILKVFTLKKFTVLLIKCFLFNVIVSQTNPCGYVSFLNDTSICFNDSVDIVANGGISYAWYPNTIFQILPYQIHKFLIMLTLHIM